MSKTIPKLVMLFLLLMVSSFAYADAPVDIEVFVREGCPHCAKAETFLHTLQQEQPALKIVIVDIGKQPDALQRLQSLAKNQGIRTVRIPAFQIRGQLLIGYSDETSTGQLIRDVLAQTPPVKNNQDNSGSCEAEQVNTCEVTTPAKPTFAVNFLGYKLSLEDVGLPLFTIAMGLLDGFNPCSMWVLLLVIALLAPMNNRPCMLAIAGTFVAVEGVAYFMFMAAWLNLFLLIGLSRVSEIAIAVIALVAGLLNLKDFWRFGWGVSLSIPNAAKPAIYERIRNILQAKNMTAAIIGAVVLALLVQIVEFMCTSGFPALYTRILTLKHLDNISYYSYLLLYNIAYMLDDLLILSIGVITLSQHRLQEKEGRWLKFISGLAMVGLGIYLLVA
ncbi:MAG: glutaredoxin domain-containing protein [Methylococcales bacterium]|nr:glutaredoxin domain-containing protein [Methylococcales bacterium]